MGKLVEIVCAIVSVISAFFIIADKANAASARLTWTTPTTRENGTPLLKAEISKYEIKYTQQGGVKKQGSKYPKASTNGYLLPLPIAGATWLFQIRVFDQSGMPSQWSVGVLKFCP